MSKSGKQNYHPDFKHFAMEGDKVLNRLLMEMRLSGKCCRQILINILKSNNIILQFNKPFTFHNMVHLSNKGKIADQVEAYIYYLHINFGDAVAKRYISREVERITGLKLN